MTTPSGPTNHDQQEPNSPTWKERLVRRRFWDKVRSTLGKVPFMEDALAAYYCAMDANTPKHVKLIAFGALAYFILPIDKIPDIIPGVGFIDDAAVLTAALSSMVPYMSEEHFQKAREFLNKDQSEQDT